MTRRIALIMLVGAMLAGCTPQVGDEVIDGWPIGGPLLCAPDQKCQELLATASVRLDGRDPNHAPVVEVRLHVEGTTVDSQGKRILTKRSGNCCSVARFRLTDGSLKAIGVGYLGISQAAVAIDYGP
jgi:hypothetical protein